MLFPWWPTGWLWEACKQSMGTPALSWPGWDMWRAPGCGRCLCLEIISNFKCRSACRVKRGAMISLLRFRAGFTHSILEPKICITSCGQLIFSFWPLHVLAAIKAAVLIQRWYRSYMARLEMRRRYALSIFQSIEYAEEQAQLQVCTLWIFLWRKLLVR